MDVTGLLVAVALASLIYIFWQKRRPSGLPPGPLHVPFIGSIFSFTVRDSRKQIQLWRRIYGDIYTFSLGNIHHVVLSGYDVIKEAFVTHALDFAGRPPVTIIGKTTNRHLPVRGIASDTYSEEWRNQRSTCLHILRDLGFGKTSIDDKIQEECEYLKETFLRTEGKPTDPAALVNISICNIICSLLFGERYDHTNEEFNEFMENFNKFTSLILKKGFEVRVPALHFLPSFRRHLAIMKYLSYQFVDFVEMKIEKRQHSLEGKNFSNPSDFIEHYLLKIREVEAGRGCAYDISEDWLTRVACDFFVAGTDTTSSALSWALLRMAIHRDKQRHLQEELDAFSSSGSCRFRFADRGKLPYLEATTLEVLRISAVADTSLTHTTTCDVKLQGYKIPEGTMVLANLLSVLKDEKLWDEPDDFRPERFIGENGTVIKPAYWTPFSLGTRICIGEQLARNELFSFLGMLVYTFDISLPNGAPTPSTEGVPMLTMEPAPYQICLKPRW